MNKNRWMRSGVAAALAIPMAASATLSLLGGMEIAAGALSAYLPATIAALLCALAAQGGTPAWIAAAFAAIGGGVCGLTAGGALREMAGALQSGDAAALAASGGTIAAVIACLIGASFFILLYRRGGTAFALAVTGIVIVVSYALNGDRGFGPAIPGLIAAVVAFAVDGSSEKPVDFARALVPAAVAVGIALLTAPQQGATWKPLSDAANAVRSLFEEYFHFTEERVPFSINAEGYDHAAEVNGLVEARLGGPANPDTDPVMRVTADADLLLRGSIRRTYTGGAWVDNTAKSRYLYLDFTRADVRKAVFEMREIPGFTAVRAEIEMLASGTSTLFVPGRMRDFSMSAQNAVYYNSLGEIFLTRAAEAGDRYSVEAYLPGEEAIRARMNDSIDESAIEGCLQLPGGVESGVYALTAEITQNCESQYDKALAIERWLKANCVYTLSPAYPMLNRDFVSQFLLDTREGYCSYFASAMTVMCRIAGVPARYVEGYYARMNGADSVILTGENAHAWTEVYLGGVGWIAFNPSGGDATGSGSAPDEPEPTTGPGSGDPDATIPPADDATLPPNDGLTTPEPTLPPTGEAPPAPNDEQSATPPPMGSESTPPPESANLPEANSANRSGPGGWILLLIAILIALLLLAWLVRKRLRAADPMRLIARADAQTAVLILYRACLTLLATRGIAPENGESPIPFARRVNALIANDDFETFARAVERCAYSRAEAKRESVVAGRRAYQTFERSLTLAERLKYTLRRLVKGLGDFSAIP